MLKASSNKSLKNQKNQINNKTLRHRLIGKKISNKDLVISDSNIESSTDFFEDIPLYRDNHIKPVRKLGKIHLYRSRRTKSTKA